MKVKELVEWLAKFPDQDATVEVLECVPGRPYCQQGGVTHSATFDPEKHAEYTDMRGNPFVPADAPYKDSRTLLLGLNDG
jgi:hypothetical protein